MADKKASLGELRVKLNQLVESMKAHVEEANERGGGRTNWSDEDKETYDRMVSDFAETQKHINESEADQRESEVSAAEQLAKKPVLRIPQIGPARDPFYSRRLDLMSDSDREVAKRAYWKTLSCLTWAGLKNGIELRGGGRAKYDGFELAIRQGVPRDVVDRFRDSTSSAEQWRLGITDGAGLGGELVPEDFQAELSRDLAGFAAVLRAGATVRPTTGSTAVYPGFQSRSTPDPKQYPSGFVGVFAAEGKGLSGGTAPTVQNQPATEQIRIPVHLWAPDAIEITRELLEDTPVALEDEIRQVIVETRGMDYDNSFLTGSGSGEPEGVTQSGATTVNYTETDVGTKWESIVNLYTDLAEQYRQDPTAGFIMSSSFLGELLKLRDSQNMPFFVVLQVAPPGAVPMSLWGKPIYVSEFVDSVGTAGNIPCIFGAWRHYRVVERRDLTIQRLVERYVPNIGFFASARVGGKTMRPAAFRLLSEVA